MIKKALTSLIFVLLPALTLAPVAYAQVDISRDVCEASPSGQLPSVCRDIDASANSNPLLGPDGLLTRVAAVLSIVVGIIAVVVMVIAGIKMSLSSGDPGKVATARSQIIYALVGLVVALLSQAIVQLVLRNL